MYVASHCGDNEDILPDDVHSLSNVHGPLPDNTVSLVESKDLITVWKQGCQMAKFDPFLSLDCAGLEGVGAQSGNLASRL